MLALLGTTSPAVTPLADDAGYMQRAMMRAPALIPLLTFIDVLCFMTVASLSQGNVLVANYMQRAMMRAPALIPLLTFIDVLFFMVRSLSYGS